LLPWDPAQGDAITDDANFGRAYTDTGYAGAVDNMKCSGDSHVWNQLVADRSLCGNKIECVSCSVSGVSSKCNISPRSATVEMRRRFHVYADGTKQYLEKAALSIGASCVSTAGESKVGWTFDNIELLI
jgi:hypothetical protein